jgi:ferric-dicitrate binding protein FerR (iron transport regulator)
LETSASAGDQALRRALDDAAEMPEVQPNKQRVWTRVQVPWAPSRGRWALGIGLTTAAVAGVVAFAILHRAPTNRETVAGVAGVVAPSANAPAFATGTLLTGPGEKLERRLARGVDVVLAPLGALLAGDNETPPEVKSGKAHFSVPHQSPGQRYVVRAAGYRVVVLGTVFDVGVESTGVSVNLQTGVVDVEDAQSGQRLAHLSAGQHWSSAEGPAVSTTPPPPTAPPRSLRRANTRLLATADTAPEAAAILASARQARQAGAARQALALYGRLAHAGGQLAESAQYEMASIEDEDLHDPARALRSWERYREQHPRGVLRAEADLSIIEMLTELGQDGRALDEARGFLRRNPGSERRGEVARVAGDLSRTRGDCPQALLFYDQALASRLSPADADDAAFQRAGCLVALPDGRAAAAAVAAYLGRYPHGRHVGEARRLQASAASPAAAP